MFFKKKTEVFLVYSQMPTKSPLQPNIDMNLVDFNEIPPESMDEKAERVVKEYGNSLLRLAYSYLKNTSDSQDIVQDTLYKYINHKESFETKSHEKAWLMRVAINLSKDKIKYNRFRRADELNENLFSNEEKDLSFVWEAVGNLSEKYRVIIHLFYYEGYTAEKIGEILNKSHSTVRSDLRRARIKLKEILKEGFDFE